MIGISPGFAEGSASVAAGRMHNSALEVGPFYGTSDLHVPPTSSQTLPSQTLPPPPCHPSGSGSHLLQEKPRRMGMGKVEGALRQTLPPDPIRQQRSNMRYTGTAPIPSTTQAGSSVAASPFVTVVRESDRASDPAMPTATQPATYSREPVHGNATVLPLASISQACANVGSFGMVSAVHEDTEHVNRASFVPPPPPVIDQILPTTRPSSVIVSTRSAAHLPCKNVIGGLEYGGYGAVLNPDDQHASHQHASLQHVAVDERRAIDLLYEDTPLPQSGDSSVVSGSCTPSTPMSKIGTSLSRQSPISSGPTSSSPPPYHRRSGTPSSMGSPKLHSRHSQGPAFPVKSSSLEDGEIVDDPGESVIELACNPWH